jgi:UDP-N-acetylglucosamine--N-acetylmuramyl-(pentapeptide) pyrophosphoryl-undecaprenol N-acetylglucosamine transferase
MRIVLTGGGTGGHFYPLIAVAEAMEDLVREKKLLDPDLVYVGPDVFDKTALLEHNISHERVIAGRVRRYRSILNFFDFFRTAAGIIRATFVLFRLYPDAVFSTGGFAAFPTLYAARLLRIPVVIYDADARPGKVSRWSSKFARWIGVAHSDAVLEYPERVRDKIAHVGHPIRREVIAPAHEGGHEFLRLDQGVPTIFVIGGSQGARAINEVVLDALPSLVEHYNVIHQAGSANLEEVASIADVILKNSQHAGRYRSFGLLNTLAIRMAAGISSIVLSRAGSGSIFEIASWGLPAIIVPIPQDISHDQTENAFSYARSGAAVVIEQRNLTQHVLAAEIDRLMANESLRREMSEAARRFAKPDAARKLATILLGEGLAHEPL